MRLLSSGQTRLLLLQCMLCSCQWEEVWAAPTLCQPGSGQVRWSDLPVPERDPGTRAVMATGWAQAAEGWHKGACRQRCQGWSPGGVHLWCRAHPQAAHSALPLRVASGLFLGSRDLAATLGLSPDPSSTGREPQAPACLQQSTSQSTRLELSGGPHWGVWCLLLARAW